MTDDLNQNGDEATEPGRALFSSPSAGRPCILLAEDDLEFRVSIAEQLRQDGYDVIEVGTGGEAVDYIARTFDPANRARRPDLLITDVRMPGLSGLEIVYGLRRADYGIPVIVMSAFGTDDVHTHAWDLGAVAVLDKPFPFRDLRVVVRQALERGATSGGRRI